MRRVQQRQLRLAPVAQERLAARCQALVAVAKAARARRQRPSFSDRGINHFGKSEEKKFLQKMPLLEREGSSWA
eukprot:983947-Prymnesium_polylepis.1